MENCGLVQNIVGEWRIVGYILELWEMSRLMGENGESENCRIVPGIVGDEKNVGREENLGVIQEIVGGN